MNLNSFAATGLTTSADHRRRPIVSRGQVARTLLLVISFALAIGVTSRASHAADGEPRRGFQAFVEGLWPQARKRGVSRAVFDRAFAGVLPDPEVIAKTHRQAEFVKPISEYLAGAVSAKRIATGQERGREWKAMLERVDARYEVDPYIILGVWGLESNFGTKTGDLSTIRCLATLAYARYRGDHFRKELIEALVILQGGHVAPAAMLGSWAGAMGQTQFMPSAFRSYAVDGDGDGRKDIWHDVPDALASTANFLKRHGWTEDLPWGFEVVTPRPATGNGTAMRPFSSWAEAGFRRADGQAMPHHGEAALLSPSGADGPHFLVTRNFKVIKRYNNSTAYALGVALLGERIAGAGPLRASWPVAER